MRCKESVGGLKELHFHCLSVIFLLQMLMVMKEKRFIVEIESKETAKEDSSMFLYSSSAGLLHPVLFAKRGSEWVDNALCCCES